MYRYRVQMMISILYHARTNIGHSIISKTKMMFYIDALKREKSFTQDTTLHVIE